MLLQRDEYFGTINIRGKSCELFNVFVGQKIGQVAKGWDLWHVIRQDDWVAMIEVPSEEFDNAYEKLIVDEKIRHIGKINLLDKILIADVLTVIKVYI